jgi:Fe-S-cluster containining protein
MRPFPRPPLFTTPKQKLSRQPLCIRVSYREILDRADRFFRDVAASQPDQLQCNGCSLCCYGLFEISAADIPGLAEGLSALHHSRRAAVIRRAVAIVAESVHPNLRECTPMEKDAFFHRTASTRCPNLSEEGRCLVYEHRPLVCRTFGVPLREGDRYVGDVCDLNFNTASAEQKFAAAWDLGDEDVLGREDEYTIPEAIIAIARMRGWLT